jgi:hypothetical protein
MVAASHCQIKTFNFTCSKLNGFHLVNVPVVPTKGSPAGEQHENYVAGVAIVMKGLVCPKFVHLAQLVKLSPSMLSDRSVNQRI